MDYNKRIEKIRDFIEKKVPAILIKNPSNIFYLTGLLEIDGTLIIDEKAISFFTSPLYYNEVCEISPSFINVYKYDGLKKFLKKYKKIGFIDTEWTFSTYTSLAKEYKLIPVPDFLKKMRMVKEDDEIELIKKALEITRKVFRDIEKEINKESEETTIAGIVHYLIRRYGGRRGDLYIFINVKKHPFFDRKDNDIYTEVTINIIQSILGAEIVVPTVDGKQAKIKIPPGTQSGKIFRLKGLGMNDIHGYGRGDEFVRVVVEVPRKLNSKQKQIILELAKTMDNNTSPTPRSFLERNSFYEE
ncbi:MAG: aminopeptidase P family N-terminal domain-containing protein [Candidatus Omnitrophica bacterium]|nr:aminopeptidase P family N-terminal domain-containing protein [Candidatus Omnitrophota bacterium]